MSSESQFLHNTFTPFRNTSAAARTSNRMAEALDYFRTEGGGRQVEGQREEKLSHETANCFVPRRSFGRRLPDEGV
jgi:hypothetical protein